MEYVDNVVDLIGGTPLVRLHAVTAGIEATVLAKVEYLNPGGSVKDRIAERMVDEAEASGALLPGGTIVEPTSGNTGVGLALLAQQRGYTCVFVCPDKVAQDKRDVLTAYGARVVITPTAVPPDHPESYYSVSDRLAREIDGAWKPDQYSNPAGPASHYASTGPEIWKDTDGRITHFVTGVGTGGTITGTGRYLKDASADRPASAGGPVRVVGVDPEGSVYSGGSGRPYLVEGVGEDFWPSAYDPAVPDEIVAVSDAQAFAMTRRLAREEGLLVGGSCGMAVVGALEVARRAGPDDVVVVLLPDSGRGYLSKIFNDGWMRSYGFLPARAGEEGRTAGDVLAGAPAAGLVHVLPTASVREAVATMAEHGVAHLVVTTAEPPVMPSEVKGSVTEQGLLDVVLTDAAHLDDPVSAHLHPPLPLVGVGEGLVELRAQLDARGAVLVAADGRPAGVLTHADLLRHLAG